MPLVSTLNTIRPSSFLIGNIYGDLYGYNNVSNDYGELGVGDTSIHNSIVPISLTGDWIEAYPLRSVPPYQSSIGIKADGSVWTCGRGDTTVANSPLGLGDGLGRLVPTKLSNLTIKSSEDIICTGADYAQCIALRSDGGISGWGDKSWKYL